MNECWWLLSTNKVAACRSDDEASWYTVYSKHGFIKRKVFWRGLLIEIIISQAQLIETHIVTHTFNHKNRCTDYSHDASKASYHLIFSTQSTSEGYGNTIRKWNPLELKSKWLILVLIKFRFNITISESGAMKSLRAIELEIKEMKSTIHSWIIYQKHFIFSNNDTICHRNITEGFKTGLAQFLFYVSSFWNNKCSINQRSRDERGHRIILQMMLMMKTRHTNTPPDISTSLKFTSIKVSVKVSRITTNANAHRKTTMPHKIRNVIQRGEKDKRVKRSCIYLLIQYKDIIPFCYKHLC